MFPQCYLAFGLLALNKFMIKFSKNYKAFDHLLSLNIIEKNPIGIFNQS